MSLPNGVITALITPFTADGSLDTDGLQLLIQRQVAARVDGILLLGTTGESPTVTPQEREQILQIGRAAIPSHIHMMVGTGSNSTAHTIALTRQAQQMGADSALVVTPYYNRPPQDGILAHFQAVAAASPIPLCVYNIPGRTGTNITTATLQKIAQIPTVCGVKETSGSIQQVTEVLAHITNFTVYAGDDAMALPVRSLGGHGVIGPTSNLEPALMRELAHSDLAHARKIHEQLTPLFEVLFIESNPIPVKTAMNLMGLPAGPCRLPLTPISDAGMRQVREVVSPVARA